MSLITKFVKGSNKDGICFCIANNVVDVVDIHTAAQTKAHTEVGLGYFMCNVFNNIKRGRASPASRDRGGREGEEK
jgi:hypothetical protein